MNNIRLPSLCVKRAQTVNPIAPPPLPPATPVNPSKQRRVLDPPTPKQLYNTNAPLRYADAINRTSLESPNALHPEQDSWIGRELPPSIRAMLNVTRGTTPAVGTAIAAQYLARKGVNYMRDKQDAVTMASRINDMGQGTLAPESPTFTDYLFNGRAANSDERFIQSIPANEWEGYRSALTENKAREQQRRQQSNQSPYDYQRDRSMRPSFGNK